VGPDQLVVRSGQELSVSLMLLDGWLARIKDLAGGERQVTELPVAGDLGDLHGFTLKRLDDDVATLSDCKIGVVPHETIREITERYPRLGRSFLVSPNMDAAV